eukprot:CAMPEP_0179460082 /NCGR_PEP_ID=MMETSP0799-20121207/43246_1 /TAXON_ID=46947 /ORGANISM="Geminigera cryophila, Strain CCMP2564" /LENGTH=215 /DNA_ID=CAMNT_0021262205 /DNA_START=244 /DNA_END=888 /DNA_ORIENTATION=-
MHYQHQHVQHYPLPGAPDEPELIGSGVASESRVLELEGQIEQQRVQQMELISRIAQQEQRTLETQREQLRMMDNGIEPGRAYRSDVAKEGGKSARSTSLRSGTDKIERLAVNHQSLSRSVRTHHQSSVNSVRSCSVGSSEPPHDHDIEGSLPPDGPGASGAATGKTKLLSAAEEELQLTEECVHPEQHVTLAQLGPFQIGLRVTFAILVGGGICW